LIGRFVRRVVGFLMGKGSGLMVLVLGCRSIPLGRAPGYVRGRGSGQVRFGKAVELIPTRQLAVQRRSHGIAFPPGGPERMEDPGSG
jgi:hypothetical protein